MAIPNWLTINPTSGNGNKTISTSSTGHTGRVARTYELIGRTTDGSSTVTANISQTPLDEFILDTSSISDIPKEGGSVTITGKSNSSKLTFTKGSGELDFTIPSTYNVNGVAATNGAIIEGDPGATSEYTFEITVTFGENTTTNELTNTLYVTTNSEHQMSKLFTQVKGDPTISVDPYMSIINAAGTTSAAGVISNTTWTIS